MHPTQSAACPQSHRCACSHTHHASGEGQSKHASLHIWPAPDQRTQSHWPTWDSGARFVCQIASRNDE
eukprot:375304-Pleurochrysis_carterae.AAC.1